ncbi:MAG: hypothetical protein ACM3JG_19875 [Thiohalocapsa sp.]
MTARLRRLLRPLRVVAATGLLAAGLMAVGPLAIGLLVVGLPAAPAAAVEMPGGTKNFTPPGYVPNYFSNESGSFNGGASARAAQRAITPAVAAPSQRRVVEFHRHGHHARRYAGVRGRTRFAHHHSAHHHGVAPHRAAYHSRGGGRPAPRIAARHRSVGHRSAGSGRRIARAGG